MGTGLFSWKKLLSWLSLVLLLLMVVSSYADSQPELKLSETAISIAKGRNAKLTPTVENVENPKKVKYTWETSDKSVASVANGTVKALNGGTAVITCTGTLEDGSTVQAQARVTVTVPVAGLKLKSTGEIKIKSGITYRIFYEITPSNATDQSLTWSSSDNSVATVDGSGNVTAVGAGKAKITAVTNDGSNRKMQANIYVPSLHCAFDSVNVNRMDGETVYVEYYGKSWSSDVTIKQKGNAFTYSVTRDGKRYAIHFKPVSAGNGSITINDKKDGRARVQIDVRVTSGAIQINQYVLIQNAACSRGNISFSYKNNSGKDIAEIEFILIPYNQFNEIVIESNNPQEGEKRYFDDMQVLKTNGSRTRRLWWGTDRINASVASVDVALRSLRFADGKTIQVPFSDLYWFSSRTRDYKSRPSRVAKDYAPDRVTLNKADSFKLGYTSLPLLLSVAKKYGYHHGGLYVYDVVKDSICEKAGLREKDLLVSIDGQGYLDDPYLTEKTKARIADGETVLFTIERYGQTETIDLTMSLEPAATPTPTPTTTPTPAPTFTPIPEEEPINPDNAEAWICPSCGQECSLKFCPNCGTAKPTPEPDQNKSVENVTKYPYSFTQGDEKAEGFYTGLMVDGLPHGYGTFDSKDWIYIGEWEYGLPTGQGEKYPKGNAD